MIKIYGMNTCPDCIAVKEQIQGRESEFEYIEIGSHVKFFKEFLLIRDNNPVFDSVRKDGKVGIPCFVFEDGKVSVDPADAGLVEAGQACSVQDHKEGKKGC